MKNIFLLDVDDTLLDFQRAEREQVIATLAEHGIAADESTADLFHVINDSLWKKLERGEITRDKLVVERFEILLEKLGAKGNAKSLSLSFFEGMPQRAYAMAGAEAFLLFVAFFAFRPRRKISASSSVNSGSNFSKKSLCPCADTTLEAAR